MAYLERNYPEMLTTGLSRINRKKQMKELLENIDRETLINDLSFLFSRVKGYCLDLITQKAFF